MNKNEPSESNCCHVKLIIILFLLFLTATNCCCARERDLPVFDKIITKDVLAGKDVNTSLFSYETRKEDKIRHYFFAYQFDKTANDEHYICLISVADAGRFIDPQQYEEEFGRRKQEYMKCYPDQWRRQLLIDFPKIGSRAQRGNQFVGPGGASYDLLLTTSDGRYDIKILISNLMPDTIEGPDLDVELIATAISERYNKAVKGN